MTYFTALDVSLRFVSICIVDDMGQVRYEAKVPAEVHRIVGCLRKFSDQIKTVGFCQRRLKSDPLSVGIVGVNLTHPGT
jgi:hypothetical protein